jgi:hypothetical protein
MVWRRVYPRALCLTAWNSPLMASMKPLLLRVWVQATMRASLSWLPLYCVFGKSRAGFAAKKLNGRSSKECHMVGITGQSSTRGTW